MNCKDVLTEYGFEPNFERGCYEQRIEAPGFPEHGRIIGLIDFRVLDSFDSVKDWKLLKDLLGLKFVNFQRN